MDIDHDLLAAIGAGDCSAFDRALEHGADLETKNFYGQTALILAAELGEVDMLKRLIREGAVIDAGDNSGKTAVHVAVVSPYLEGLECLDILIASGANLNVKDMHKITPVHDALKSDNADALKKLIEAGADIHAKNNWDSSALNIAIWHEKTECLDLLLAAGAEPSAEDELYSHKYPALSAYFREKACKDQNQKINNFRRYVNNNRLGF